MAGTWVLWRVCPGLRWVRGEVPLLLWGHHKAQAPNLGPEAWTLTLHPECGVRMCILGIFIRLLLTPAIQYRQTSFSQILWFVFSQIVAIHRYCVFFLFSFYKLQVCGTSVPSKSIKAILPTAYAYFTSVSQSGNSCIISNLFHYLICDQRSYYCKKVTTC